ncbi:MAG: hypothetical protein EAX90_13420 [Candidatus Heimdallarchaeota archaeon]|nr:hypothetical protein [Candidatus Heimdallarchaeota archaeon]
MPNKYKISLNGMEFDLEEKNNEVKIEDYRFKPEVIYNGSFYRVFINGVEMKVEFKENAVFLDGKEIDFDFRHSPTLIAKRNLQFKKGADIKAAIPGKIVDIKVKIGQQVKDQECLLVLESMKMRNEILSPINGIIDQIAVNIGDQVVSKQLLLKIKHNKEERNNKKE